ncbi:hypothetical protein [Halolamina sediminis]|uniref:hypothetical protein n=1 Tax=Halolamina sediminis TaxID=1480675 RepID=UPI0006B4F48C|nr:hypothetical protein [Halolamina sediminis]
MPPLITPKALARTYNHPSKDPWTAVELYREAATKPDDWGAQRVASAINSDQSNDFEGISRSEVRAWVDDDSKPDAARAVDVARELGWDADGWTDTTEALAELVIGVYAFGSIVTENYVPSWSPDDPDSQGAIEDALTWAGVGYQHVERDGDAQADEIRPGQQSTKLGRVLVVAGAPMGDKNADSVHGLPDWVADAPMVLKLNLAVILVRGRGTEYEGKGTRTIQTDRGPQYFRDVARLIEDVTGETATASEHGVTISAAAVRELGLLRPTH